MSSKSWGEKNSEFPSLKSAFGSTSTRLSHVSALVFISYQRFPGNVAFRRRQFQILFSSSARQPLSFTATLLALHLEPHTTLATKLLLLPLMIDGCLLFLSYPNTR